MAILYKTTVSKSPGVEFFPPSLKDSAYYTIFYESVNSYINAAEDDVYIILFDNYSELTTYINDISLTAEQQEVFNEWKTANNITITYELFDLDVSATAAPTPFGS